MRSADPNSTEPLTPLGVDQQRAAVAEVRRGWDGVLEGIEGMNPMGLDLDDDPF